MINQIAKSTLKDIKNAYYLYRFKRRILQEIRQPELILVHQMGKVGSMSIYNSLKRLDLDIPIYHTHNLIPKNFKNFDNKIKIQPYLAQKEQLITEWCIYHKILQGVNNKKWKIITLVREPIAKNISDFFQNLNNPFFHRNGTIENKEIDELIQYFLDGFHHRWVLNWLNQNINDVFGIDVFSQEFPKDKGYQIFTTNNVEILLMRTEDINLRIKDAMKEFMNLQEFNIIKTNIGNKKNYAQKYKKFKESIRLPQSYIDEMYNSKYTQHFYSEEEIEKFKAKWLKKA
ncbi:MAG: putative capsular polysaccharide synthesis family protein [Crocosphaera sp.]|nr:putative capsular polysaccharide synthesis family protein [Crocosphaera sp.]